MRVFDRRSPARLLPSSLPSFFTTNCLAGALGLALLLCCIHPATAQPRQPRTLSPQAELSLITGLPGDLVHTEFGHSAIRVHDPVRGIDWLYNYGTFNFSDPYFVPKFTYGRLRYFLSISSYRGMVDVYYSQGRPVIEQTLNLTAEQRAKLWAFLRHNAHPENRYYRYDFLYDNCSTRIRDAFINALGDDVDFSGAPDPDLTFRQMLDLYVGDRPLLDVGFDLGLGTPTDADVSASEAMFLPEYLLEAFDAATIRADGRVQPLVAETDTVTWIENYDAREAVFPWPVALAWAVFALGAAWTGWQMRTGRPPGRAVDAALLTGAGVAGLVMCFLWFVAEHTVTNYNWNLLWAWPTHLVAAVMLARNDTPDDAKTAPNGDDRDAVVGTWTRRYLVATAVVTGLLCAGWAVVPQNLHAALLPVALGLTMRTAWHAVQNTPIATRLRG